MYDSKHRSKRHRAERLLGPIHRGLIMKIVIQLADTVTTAAFARVEQAAAATRLNHASFNGDEISVEYGDFTCIAEGDDHSEAPALYQLVQDVVSSGPFDRNGPYIEIPYAGGGVYLAQVEA
jgi:hypothetical protein